MKGRSRLTLYLSGPMAGCSDEEMLQWRQEVKSELASYYEFLDPTRRDYRADEGPRTRALADRVTVKDKVDLLNSDVILANISTNVWNPNSFGTAQEILYGWMHSRYIIVISDREVNSYWVIAHSHVIVKSIGEAIEYLKGYHEALHPAD